MEDSAEHKNTTNKTKSLNRRQENFDERKTCSYKQYLHKINTLIAGRDQIITHSIGGNDQASQCQYIVAVDELKMVILK